MSLLMARTSLGGKQKAALGLTCGVIGSALALLYMSAWSADQGALALAASANPDQAVLGFFAVEFVTILLIMVGIHLVYSAAKTLEKGQASVLSVISEAFSSRPTMKAAMVIGAAYAAVFSVLSGSLVYQPTVDFASVYGAANPGYAAAVCCGDLGSVPELSVFVSPAYHLGAQLLPLSLLLLAVVPVLVTLNSAVAIHSLRQKRVRSGRWVASLGAFVGLWTGCPTCAGYFMLSAVGGLGVSAFTFVLDPYQTAFVLVSIPLLIAGPFLTAYGVKRALSSQCAIQPTAPGARSTKGEQLTRPLLRSGV